ncbi:MAG: MarR family transcriptional regulator [Chloroflexota bacterium]|nr:MarR family transcriptional regulator [Chloroflexota bacterium]
MTPSEDSDALDSINRTLARVMRLSGSRSMFARQAAAAGVELSQPSYVLLRILIDEGPSALSGLARAAHMDMGMAARRVAALVESGLATRESDPRDGRVSQVVPTPQGKRVARALQDVRRGHLERALAGWSAAELRDFDRLLGRFLADTTATSIEDG